MNDPCATCVVPVILHWTEVLEAVEDITAKAPADRFAEYDARKLDEAAARIRAKLKDREYENEHVGLDG